MADKHGPKFMEVVCYKVARDAIPEGGGLADGVALFAEPNRLQQHMKSAIAWVEEAIRVMRTAPDNPWGDDEEILAGAILDEIERRGEGRRA
jgi:hypothetical protein